MKKKVVLKEAAPIGSFEHIRELIRTALETMKGKFGLNSAGDSFYPYIVNTFLSHVIVEVGDEKFYDLPYAIGLNGDTVELGDPVEVEKIYVVKETDIIKSREEKVIKESKSLENELKEAHITIKEKATDKNVNFDFISLNEANYNEASGELASVILIEQGTNDDKKRHYPESTIREAAPYFAGLKMYLNHPTAKEEKEQPERDITKWASTIVESHYENGKVMAKVAVHDAWLRERLQDNIARQHIGLSILTGGKVSYGNVNGKNGYQIVEKIVFQRQNGPVSVDWVTEAGARGRVSKLLKESGTKKGEKKMELHEASFDDLQRENPSLLTKIKESIVKDLKESDEAKAKENELKEAKEELKKLKLQEKQAVQKVKVSEILKEAKLPEAAKAKLAKDFESKSFETLELLETSLRESIKSELEYISKFSSKGAINLGENSGGGAGATLQESIQKRCDSMFGIKEKEEDQK